MERRIKKGEKGKLRCINKRKEIKGDARGKRKEEVNGKARDL